MKVNKQGLTRDIPERVRRQVRQECGFGCVICGKAFIHYEHIVNYSEAVEHEPAKMALLCGGHHDEVSRKMLSKQTVLEARTKPKALEHGYSFSSLDYKQSDDVVVEYGNLTMRNVRDLVMAGGESLFSIRKGELPGEPLCVAAKFYDQTGALTFEIVDNIYRAQSRSWDFVHEGETVTVRQGPGDIVLQISFTPRKTIRVERLKMLVCGVELNIDTHTTRLNGTTFDGTMEFENSEIGVFANEYVTLIGRGGNFRTNGTITFGGPAPDPPKERKPHRWYPEPQRPGSLVPVKLGQYYTYVVRT